MEIIHKMYSLHLLTILGQQCVYSQGIDATFLPFKDSRVVRIFRIDVMPDRSAIQTEITHNCAWLKHLQMYSPLNKRIATKAFILY